MVSPELQKKFEELFIDEYTEDQYEEWFDKKYEKKTRKDNILLLIILIIGLSIPFGLLTYLNRDRVDQTIVHENLMTCVWINNNIAKALYTPIDQLTDSIKTAQRIEGERLLKILK